MGLAATGAVLAAALAIAAFGYLHLTQILLNPPVDPNATSIFDFTVPLSDNPNDVVPLSTYKGKKAYLVVNVACKCGLTDKNYAELQHVYDKYRNKGLEILAFPCNNFANQEPGTHDEILAYVREKKQAAFPILGKVECDNRGKTHPLFVFLKSRLSHPIFGRGLIWNFAKFLVNEHGVPVKRFLPSQSPLSFEEDIKALLES